MNAEIEGYLDQLLSIVQDAPGIVAGLSEEQFYHQPALGRWSIGECFEHLNLTAGQFEKPIQEAIETARRNGWISPGPFSYGLLDRWFVRSMEPPPRLRLRARAGFRPEGAPGASPDNRTSRERDNRGTDRRPPEAVMDEFYGWQETFRDLLKRADGVDLRRTRLRSPVLPAFRYSLGTCFAATLAHERRHLWQARQVRKSLG